MGLILPNYLLQNRRFKCSKCSFAFIKQTPSQVEKCPKCNFICFDRNYKQGEPLDPYSKAKLRWYEDETGQRHQDEIKHRKIEIVNGKKQVVITDSKGKRIDILPNFNVQKDIGKSKALKEI
jgi:hypothetical protein